MLVMKIKAVKSNRDGEYYDRYDGSGEQRPGPFVLFLNEYGFVPQYTMLDKPSTNDPFFETGNARILEEVEFGKEENIKNVVFEEESVNDIGQVLIPITV
ncbi:hypothetical protein CR513_38035, partial [Mucuna pruriens]